ncbi:MULTISPECIES: hypothetical protein [Okeania]|uniref:hypothetical protein n=1 Tax=Okeania TaxID=1458928 RepID=UPI000F521D83|nr:MULTISPECIES: hypothetical protein [Okeania]NET13511.1 hypothetical protein [Okeania sp. SIO1H6]NET22082.1 hypothetical protein [Okeania sp. SIO1H5]NET95389.1 hypothetical protein [Okeania sp. SIO1H2]RQH10355.1 hypothetical protein D4Z78_28190 [Okeania hirsuta]
MWGAGEQGAGEKGERIIVDRKNYLSYQKKCTFSYTFSLTKTFERLVHNLSIMSTFYVKKDVYKASPFKGIKKENIPEIKPPYSRGTVNAVPPEEAN